MPTRFYLVPKIGSGTNTDTFRPKYFQPTEGDAWIRWSAVDGDDWMLVKAETTPEQHTTLVGYADVLAAPANLSDRVTGVPAMRTRLEAFGIPSEWVTASTTYGDVIKAVATHAHFSQKMRRRGGTIRTLDVPLKDVPAARERLRDVASQFGVDANSVGVTANMTVRQALRKILPAMQDRIATKMGL